MIVVLTGTNPYSFDRLVRTVDQSLGKEFDVFIQLGNTKYVPLNCEYINFLDNASLIQKIESASLVISQGGFGSIMTALNASKPVIAVPRLPSLGESQDHQIDLVQYYLKKQYLAACLNIDDLTSIAKSILNNELKFKSYVPETSTLIRDEIVKFLCR